MTIRQKRQKIPYQTPKLEVIGVFVSLIGGSPIRVPIQLDLPSDGEK
jgi:hypothetical protein